MRFWGRRGRRPLQIRKESNFSSNIVGEKSPLDSNKNFFKKTPYRLILTVRWFLIMFNYN